MSNFRITYWHKNEKFGFLFFVFAQQKQITRTIPRTKQITRTTAELNNNSTNQPSYAYKYPNKEQRKAEIVKVLKVKWGKE